MLGRPLNKMGMIMVSVFSFIVLMSLLFIGMFARNSSSGQQIVSQTKAMKAEILARGGYARAYHALNAGMSLPATWTENIDGQIFTISSSSTPSGIGGVSSISIEVTF